MRLAFVVSFFALAFTAFSQDPASTDPKQRVKAARAMGKQGSEAIPKLQSMLTDPVLDVRLEAVKAICDIGTHRSLDALIQATRDNDPEVQMRATDGLVNFYLPGYLRTGISSSINRVGAAIKVKFNDTNDQVIEPFVTVRPEVVMAVGRLVRSGVSMESRANAARAIGILRGRPALQDLYTGLRSKNDTLMYESLIALQKIRDPASGLECIFLLRDLDERVQVAAVETVGLLRTREALPNLKVILKDTRSEKVRRKALESVAFIPDEGNRPVLTQYLDDKDDALRAAAAEGLGRLKNPADLVTFEKAFADERKMNARLAQAFALVKQGKLEMTEFSPLRYLLNTVNSKAWRGIASGYLVELAREEFVRQAIYKALPSAPRDEKIEIAKVLAQSGDKDSIAALDGLANDGDSAVAQEGLRALRSVKSRNP